MRMRLWGAAVIGICVVGLSSLLVGPSSAAPRPPAPVAVGAFYTDTTTIGGVPTFAGITGFDRVANGRYVLIPKDSAPGRFFTGSIRYASGVGGFQSTGIDGGAPILGPGNLPLLPGAAQFEGIRRAGSGYVVVSGGAQPFVRLIGSIGLYGRDLPLPTAWRPAKNTGLDPRRGLTGVAVGPGGQISVLTAGGLRQDPANAARLLTFGRTNPEFTYRTDRDTRAADILAINATDYLVLERGAGRVTRIFFTTTRGADRVTGKSRLTGQEKAMSKRLIFSSSGVPRLNTGNMSGLAWGNWQPDLPWQRYRARTLFVITDDAVTRVHSFEVHLPR